MRTHRKTIGRRVAWSRGLAALALAWTSNASRTCFAGLNTDEVGPPVAAVIPNQSVSLTPSPDDAQAAGESAVAFKLQADAANTTSAALPSAPFEPATPDPRVADRPAPGRARFSSVRPTLNTDDDSEPWYRSGLGALAVVLALIGLFFFLLRRGIGPARTVDADLLKVVSRCTLGQKHSVALLQCGRRFILVGLSPEGVNTLSELTESEETTEIAARVLGGNRSPANRFPEMLADAGSSYKEPSASEVISRAKSPRPQWPAVRDLLRRVRTFQAQGEDGRAPA